MGVKIKTSDLKYEYSDTATNGDSPQFTGKPDSLLFNREEEYEVVPMLESVMNELDTKKKPDLHRLEDMVQDDLPGRIRKREDVFDWLVENF